MRRQQVEALNASADPNRSYLARGTFAAAAVLSTPVAVVESLTTAPGGRAADALGTHLQQVESARSAEDFVFAGVQAGGDFVEAFGAFGTLAAPLAPRASHAPLAASLEADAAQATNPRPDAVAALDAGGKVFTSRSVKRTQPRTLDARVQDSLDRIPPGERTPGFHGQCAEPGCLSDALQAGVDPRGGTISSASVGRPGTLRQGAPLLSCPSCQVVLRDFGLTWLPPDPIAPLSPATPVGPLVVGTAAAEERRR